MAVYDVMTHREAVAIGLFLGEISVRDLQYLMMGILVVLLPEADALDCAVDTKGHSLRHVDGNQ